MAKQVFIKLIDDLDNTQEAVETVTFSVGKQDFEIDLSQENLDQFNADMARWIENARRSKSARRSAAPARTSQSNAQNAAIREWATAQGMEVSARGRIAQQVIDAYSEANAS